MPHFFINLFNDQNVIDDEGFDLADIAEARAVAIDSARDAFAGADG